MSELIELFDRYNRVARLTPTVLGTLPLLLSALVAYVRWPDKGWLPAAMATLIGSCILYWLSSVVRERGKLIQPRLLAAWHGWPSTAMLRESDNRIDRLTKLRYKLELGRLCDDLQFPSFNDETSDPDRADEIYRSATIRLIEARRGHEYKVLHSENASYGFRRNMLGIKPIAIGITTAMCASTVARWCVTADALHLGAAAAVRSFISNTPVAALTSFDIAWLAMWLLLITPAFVYHAACEYADALLKTLDVRGSLASM